MLEKRLSNVEMFELKKKLQKICSKPETPVNSTVNRLERF